MAKKEASKKEEKVEKKVEAKKEAPKKEKLPEIAKPIKKDKKVFEVPTLPSDVLKSGDMVELKGLCFKVEEAKGDKLSLVLCNKDGQLIK